MKHFDAIIFDMDGLLLDSERIALSCFHEACAHFGLDPQTELFMSFIGTNAVLGREMLRKGLDGRVDHVEFLRAWKAIHSEKTSGTPVPLKTGAEAILDEIAALGRPIAVATSSGTERAKQKLRSAGILDAFDVIIGGDQVYNSKPHPEIYQKAAEALKADCRACLALEDSDNGVRAAVAAGMTVVQIPDLVKPSEELTSLGHIILDSLHDVSGYRFRTK